MAQQITFQGDRLKFVKLVNQLMDSLSGRNGAGRPIAEGFLTALGFAALSSIKDAYVIKARGGRDAMGIQWRPLSREYLAYGRRFGSGDQAKLKKAAGLGAGNKFAPGGKKGLLNKEQLKRWQQIYSQKLARLLLSFPEAQAKAYAASEAWVKIKAEGAKTKLDVFGNRQVEILRDTGVLLNSLSPGRYTPGGTYTPPHAEQIFEIRNASVIVGTNVAYAAVHNYGNKSRPKMPRRQFLPDNEGQIPEEWARRWLDIASKAMEIGIRKISQEGRV